jgi:tRNA(fMet)-specific endonuclease VapC
MRAQVLLDTDILSLLRRGHERVTQHATDYIVTYGSLAFTELTWYEVVRGYRAIGAHRQLKVFEAFCQRCDIFPLDHNALDCAANIYADLRRRGELIGEVDILIAGIAFAHRTGIATQNVEHFSRIAGLHVENWTV